MAKDKLDRHSPCYRIAIDVGGTFTDGAIIDTRTGDFLIAKVPSTPKDPSLGFMHCLERLLQLSKARREDVGAVIHGTTVATNAIFEHKIARTGLITNEGFTDVLEIGRMDRPSLYDLLAQRPKPLVPGRWRLGVEGRIYAGGEIVQHLNAEQVKEAANVFERDGVLSIAICFLHSYANPIHEREAASILGAEYPEAYVSVSSEVCPVHGEYGRMSTTVINACLLPMVGEYLSKVEEGLKATGIQAPLYVLQSNGGTMRSDVAKSWPAHLIESGPAAGVIASAHIGAQLGRGNVISFDMGGTTAKVGLVKDGTPDMTMEFEVGSMVQTRVYETGGGYPLKLPAIDLAEVGAGGGSIAWIDAGGALRVGPQSAGADPGPACYQMGGREPTVTDANLVAGRINPDYFLGGEMEISQDASRQVIEQRIGGPLRRNASYAALGIVDVANANMLRALRAVSSMRGYDPRDYALVALGGAGPMHACELARDLKMREIIIPPSPGVTTALGLLTADVRHDYTRGKVQRMDQVDVVEIRRTYGTLESEGRASLQVEGISQRDMLLKRSADLRYQGQLYSISVPIRSRPGENGIIEEMIRSFHDHHERLYGHCAPEEPVELVALRVRATGSLTKPKPKLLEVARESPESAVKSKRPVLFRDEGWISSPIYDRYRLKSGHCFRGPAIVEEVDSTTVIPTGFEAEMDKWGNILITLQGEVV